jgi:hypothetical protein
MNRGRKPITRDTAQQPGKDEFTRAAAPPVDGACACGTAVAQRSPVLDAAQAVAYCTAEAERTRSVRVMVSWAASPAGRPSAAARSTRSKPCQLDLRACPGPQAISATTTDGRRLARLAQRHRGRGAATTAPSHRQRSRVRPRRHRTAAAAAAGRLPGIFVGHRLRPGLRRPERPRRRLRHRGRRLLGEARPEHRRANEHRTMAMTQRPQRQITSDTRH